MYKDKIKRGIIKPSNEYVTRVHEEFRVFKKINMIGFMLFMSELCCWCWDNGIPVGPCRGSVGGSMIAYLTDIIDVNPLIWDTIFSRFANESRQEIGDIDLDISPTQRQLVYDHIITEFGFDKTAYILAIGTIAEKGTIDDIGRGLSFIWDENHKGSKEENPYSLERIAMIKSEYEKDPEGTKERYKDLFYYFDGMVNTAVSQSMHPAGIVVSPVTLPDNYGTFWSDGKRILSINMEEIHEISLVKYDILGLKSLEVIKDTCQMANIPYPKSHMIDWNDKDVWTHITDSPVGIFQFESQYAFNLLKDYKPTRVNDLSLVNASLRPSGESYRDRLIARQVNHNPSKIIDDLLSNNNNYLVFQEDTIKFLMNICGMSGSEADNVRRAIGRKQKDRLDAALPQILEGYCSKSDKPREVAEQEAREFLKIISDSANYQFGFNHSTGYSMIGYMCGYLRYYYPKEFIAAYLNNANNDNDILTGTALAETLGIKIYPIKFRKSSGKYVCDKSGIYKGIESVKFIGEGLGEELFALKDEEFPSFVSLLERLKQTSIDSKQLDILIKLDFFSEFGDVNKLLKQVEIYNSFAYRKQFSKSDIGKFGVPVDRILKYVGKETAKLYKDVDVVGLITELVENIEVPKLSLLGHIKYELELLGYPTSTDPKYDKRRFFIIEINSNRAVTRLKLYEIFSGRTYEVNVWNREWEGHYNATVGSIIHINKVEPKNKKEPTGEVDAKGKKIYRDVPGKFEFWLKRYYIVE